MGGAAGVGEAVAAAEEAGAPASDFQPVDEHVGYPGVGAGGDGVAVHSAGWKVSFRGVLLVVTVLGEVSSLRGLLNVNVAGVGVGVVEGRRRGLIDRCG